MRARIVIAIVASLLLAAVAEATVRGQVMRRDTGQPYAGVQVTLSGAAGRSVPAYTDGQGMYYLQNVPPGAYTLEVRSKRQTVKLPVTVTREPYTNIARVSVN